MNVKNFPMLWINKDGVTLTEKSIQAVDGTKLEISIIRVGRYFLFLFFFSNYYMLLLWLKGREVTGSTVRTLQASSLRSHGKRRKGEPWRHHLTSLCLSFPVICEMRTLTVYPTKRLKGTRIKSMASPGKACEVIFYRSTKDMLIPSWDINEWLTGRIMCRPGTECSFSLK